MIRKFIADVNIDFSDIEILGMAEEYENQSQLLYELVRRIAEKIEAEVA